MPWKWLRLIKHIFVENKTRALGARAILFVLIGISALFAFVRLGASDLFAQEVLRNIYAPSVLGTRMWVGGWLTDADPLEFLDAVGRGENLTEIVGADKIFVGNFFGGGIANVSRVFQKIGFHANDPSVVRAPDGSGLLMYYTALANADARDQRFDRHSVGLAKSRDEGTSWQDEGIVIGQNNGFDNTGAWAPGAVVVGNEVWVYYHTSEPGPKILRTRFGSNGAGLIATEQVNVPRDFFLVNVDVARQGDQFVMVGNIVGNSAPLRQILRYISSDGVGWISDPLQSNPLLSDDSALLLTPHLEVVDDQRYRVYFGFDQGSGSHEIRVQEFTREVPQQVSARGGVFVSGIGIQLSDRGCTGQFGEIRTRIAGTGWSDWVGDANGYDFDCGRFLFSGSVSPTPQQQAQDFRMCLQLNDGGDFSQLGNEQCTPWASENGGWSGWAGDANGYDPDWVRIKTELRPLPAGVQIDDARVWMQFGDFGRRSRIPCEASGDSRPTPWASEGGGWSGWATDSNAYDPDCVNFSLEVKTSIPASQAAASLSCSPATQTTATGQQVTLAASGGEGNYKWVAPSGNPNEGTGPAFSTTFGGPGSYAVYVQNQSEAPPGIATGPNAVSCNVSVFRAGTQPPPLSQSPPSSEPPSPGLSPLLSGENNNSQCVGLDAPDVVVLGQEFRAVVRMRNTGTASWWGNGFANVQPYRLTDVYGQFNRWGITSVNVFPSPIRENDTAAFEFIATAPREESSYSFSWQMAQENTGAFGQWCSKGIEVVNSNDPVALPPGVVLPTSSTAPSLACSASPSAPTNNDTVRWSVDVSGGQNPFRYQWSGTDGLSGVSQSVQKTYTVTGTKQGSVRVTAANGEAQSCANSVFVWPPAGIIAEPYCDGDVSKARISWRIETEGGSGDEGFYTDIDDDADWGNGFWNRFTPAGFNTVVVPDGFSAFGGPGAPLILRDESVYRARVYYVAGRSHTPTTQFTAAVCAGSGSQPPGVFPPGSTPPPGTTSPPGITPPSFPPPPGSTDSGSGGGGGFPFDGSLPAPSSSPGAVPPPSGIPPPGFGASPPPPPPPPVPLVSIISFSAAPSSIRLGETANLTWSTENALSCRIDQNIGSVPVNDSRAVAPRDTTTYILTCADVQGGRDQERATLTVRKPGSATFQEVPPE